MVASGPTKTLKYRKSHHSDSDNPSTVILTPCIILSGQGCWVIVPKDLSLLVVEVQRAPGNRTFLKLRPLWSCYLLRFSLGCLLWRCRLTCSRLLSSTTTRSTRSSRPLL
ncbi:hypothetical protein DPMN_179036 [Dreissena polymorpha]|uniref:Uncharacterized protein n=1 Tax=Dreissena polymorpha TaxID=45954 RepID=A0A9D4IN50_DREPO|nr:hypothetical protein DPMN_179036 [Dreissena polymorpha]